MTQTTNTIPALRFPEFNESWSQSRLADIATKVGSGSTPRGGEEVYQSSGVVFIRSQNVIENKLSLDDVVFISEEVNNQMRGSIVSPNDILLNITGGSIGRSCVVPATFSEGNVNQHVCIIRVDERNDPRFLQPFLSSARGQKLIFEGQTGSGREGLNFQSIRAFKLFLPALREQEKIAAFLSAVDERIGQLARKKELLLKYKNGVMQQIFSQKIRFKDNNGNDFPDWEEKTLGELGSTYGGLAGKSADDFGKGFPYVTYKQIFDSSKIKPELFEYVKIGTNEKQNTAQYGDVFFTTSSETPGEVAFASVLLEPVSDLYLNSFCFGFRPNSLGQLTPDFARYLFRSSQFRRKVFPLAQGSTRYNISKREMMKLKILLPSPKEQLRIGNFLTTLDEKLDLIKNQIEVTKEFKKGLLQQMFV